MTCEEQSIRQYFYDHHCCVVLGWRQSGKNDDENRVKPNHQIQWKKIITFSNEWFCLKISKHFYCVFLLCIERFSIVTKETKKIILLPDQKNSLNGWEILYLKRWHIETQDDSDNLTFFWRFSKFYVVHEFYKLFFVFYNSNDIYIMGFGFVVPFHLWQKSDFAYNWHGQVCFQCPFQLRFIQLYFRQMELA